MNPVVIRTKKRAPAAAMADFAALGVSTTHEAMGRSGLLKPFMRPI